jgi:hypothetical protein
VHDEMSDFKDRGFNEVFPAKEWNKMRPKIATFELKKHVIIKYEDLVYPSPASRCSSVAPAVRKALAQPKVQTCRGGQNAVGVQEFLVVILYIYIHTHYVCVYIIYIHT